MRTLVTGAAGFIGRRLVKQCLSLGDEVTAVSHFRSSSPETLGKWLHDQLPEKSDWPLRLVAADIRDAAAMKDAMTSIDRVFHLAAAVATGRPSDSQSINVDGTDILATAAARSSRPTLVFVSSLAAAGPREIAIDETAPCHPISQYGRTKYEAERSLKKWSAELPITIARPPCVFGPGDRNLLALYQTVARGWNVVLSKTFAYSYISVDDLVTGLIAAANDGDRINQQVFTDGSDNAGVYYLTDPQPLTFPQLADMIGSSIGREHVRHVKIPNVMGFALGKFGDLALTMTGRKVFLNSDKIREGVGGSWICRGDRAKRELNFAPARSLRVRIDETTAHYRDVGWI
ncbi:MAG: NAD-dependent epimerase/dehydratase family protein [Planctomycetota bacterium]